MINVDLNLARLLRFSHAACAAQQTGRQDMEMGIEIAILLASLSAGLYCWSIDRTLRRLHREKEGVAATIAQLDRAVQDCRLLFVQTNALAVSRGEFFPTRSISRADAASASERS